MKHWLRIFLGAVVACVGLSCAGAVTLSGDTRASLNGLSMVGTPAAPVPLELSGSGATFAAAVAGPLAGIGAAMDARSAGSRLVAEYAIEDPADRIRERLAARLMSEVSVRYEGIDAVDSMARSTAAIAEAHPGANLVLDVQTQRWRVFYLPLSGGKYGIYYAAKMRLIDTAHSRVVAGGDCWFNPIYGEASPTLEDLLQDRARRLKLELAKAVDECTDHLSTESLGLASRRGTSAGIPR